MFVRILRLLTPVSHDRAPVLGVEALEDRAVPAAIPLLRPDGFGPVPFAVFRPVEPPAPPELASRPALERPGEPPLGPFVGSGLLPELPRPPRELVAQLRQFADRPIMIAVPPLRAPLSRGLFGPAFPQPVQTSPDPADEGEPVERSAPPSVPPVPPLVLASAVRGAGYLRDVLAPEVGTGRAEPAPVESQGGPPTSSPEVVPTVAPIVVAIDPTSASQLSNNILQFAPLRELARDAWERVETALPELSLPEDFGSDAVPELWQIGVCLVTAATVWAVTPSRSRSRPAFQGDGAADPAAGEWSERGANP
jgi:hypothetical protein